MKPEDVPDDLIDLFDKGAYERCYAYTGNSQITSEHEYFRGGIAAVYDEIEKQVRAKVADEIEMENSDPNSDYDRGLYVAARIARGEST